MLFRAVPFNDYYAAGQKLDCKKKHWRQRHPIESLLQKPGQELVKAWPRSGTGAWKEEMCRSLCGRWSQGEAGAASFSHGQRQHGLSLSLRLTLCLGKGRRAGALLWGNASASFCSGKTVTTSSILLGPWHWLDPDQHFPLSHACTFPLKCKASLVPQGFQGDQKGEIVSRLGI